MDDLLLVQQNDDNLQQDDNNLSNDIIFGHDPMQQNYDSMNNINLDILSPSDNNDNLYYQQNYIKDNNIYTHQPVSEFDHVIVDNNYYNNDQPSTSSLNIISQQQNNSNQQHLHQEIYQPNGDSNFLYIKQDDINEFKPNSHNTINQRQKIFYHQDQPQNYDYQHHLIITGIGNEENDFYEDEYINENINKENINNSKLVIRRLNRGSATRKEGHGKRNDEPQTAGGYVKPSYSYSCLITLALKNSLNGELTVSEIYAFLW